MAEVLLELIAIGKDSQESIAVITLNRPKAKNAINRSMSLKLAEMLADVRERKYVR